MNVLLVCQTGATVGLGHLTRSLLIARALSEKLSAKVHFLIQGEVLHRGDLSQFASNFIAFENCLLSAIKHCVDQQNSQLVILDLKADQIPNGIEKLFIKLKQARCKIIAIDGFLDYRSYLDLIFIPSFQVDEVIDSAEGAPLIFGWDCYLLNTRYPAQVWKKNKRVLVLTGGSDVTGLGQTLPSCLNSILADNTEVHWVTGPYAKSPVMPESPRISIVNHPAPSGLDELMMSAAYAMTVFGVSFFELLYYGKPTVVFSPYAEKDDAILAQIQQQKIAMVANDELKAVKQLKILMENDLLAQTFADDSRQIPLHKGAEKIVECVSMLFIK